MPDYQQRTPITPEAFIKLLQTIHLALFAGQAIFAIIMYTQFGPSKFDIKNTSDPFLYAVPLVAIVAFIASNILFKQYLNKAISKESLHEKTMLYQTAYIVRFAPLEGASLFGLVVFFLTHNLFFLLVSIILMVYFLTLRPTKDKMVYDLNITYPY